MPDSDRESRFRQMREKAREIFQHTLAEASIAKGFARHVHCERGVLRVREDLYDLHSYSRVLVVSLGKAGHTMVEALSAQVGASLEGIVASSVEPAAQVHGFRYFRGGHPHAQCGIHSSRECDVADAGSAAGLGAGDLFAERWRIVDRREAHRRRDLTRRSDRNLSRPGAFRRAHRRDQCRAQTSIRGEGRTPGAGCVSSAAGFACWCPTCPTTRRTRWLPGRQCPIPRPSRIVTAIAEKYELLKQFPQSTRELFERHALDETPKSDDPAFHRARWWTVLSNQSAIDEASVAAERAGFIVHVDNSCDDWDYARAADYLLQRVRELRKQFSPVCLISGGEVTVKVADGGVGGRNQQFALACAEKIAGENIMVLSAGTDGVDGNSPAAGAVVDGTTLERARGRRLDARAALAKFDAYPFFAALGDAIEIGPTGNNLRDLRILLAY